MLMRLVTGLLWILTAAAAVKPVPPPGIAVSAADRATLEAGLARLKQSMDRLGANPLLPDVLIYHKAVRFALEGDEFFKPAEVERAKELLAAGQARADALAQGQAPWNTATGLVVRGYISKIDGSVQPYGLVVPPTYSPVAPHAWRLDTWFHGRNETLSEVNFLVDRQKNPGEFTPPDTIVLHLYGRYCNANKFAGEVDLFEALEDVKRHYRIDEHRIVVRGFSMGGAAAWHIATHYAGLWAAAAPGAGFAETAEFVQAYHKEPKYQPTWYEEKLWHLTNATDYAANLYQCPTVAYNGDQDPQRQAADIMERNLEAEGMRLERVWGPGTGHKYHPDSKPVINRIVDANAERGNDFAPSKIRFTTWTLAYNRMKWVTVNALAHHWERARVNADVTSDHAVSVRTVNVTDLSLDLPAGSALLDPAAKISVDLDDAHFLTPGPMTDRSWTVRFRKQGARWAVAEGEAPGLHKKHALQGPIDDAFLDRFLMVRPTGTAGHAAIAQWSASEAAHAKREWRRQFRGEVIEKNDSDVTDADIASSNLVLWGDPASNRLLARIADKLPIQWTGERIVVGSKSYPADRCALVMIYPNPLNPAKYVVLNSGVTFREADYRSNAWQVAKLPDYAVIDTATPPDEEHPGKIADAGFFGEAWELP